MCSPKKEKTQSLADAKSKYQKARKLLSNALDIDQRIKRQKAELSLLEEKIGEKQNAETQLQNRVDILQPLVSDYEAKLANLTNEQYRLENLQNAANAREVQLNAREASLQERERCMRNNEANMQKINQENKAVQQLIPVLRSLVHAVNSGTRKDLSSLAVAREAAKIASELRSNSTTLVRNRMMLAQERAELKERETLVREREDRVQRREHSVTTKDTQLKSERERLQSLRREVESQRVDVTRRINELRERERIIQSREAELYEGEKKQVSIRTDLDRRERLLQGQENTLKLREESIRRKEEVVEAREKAIDRKEELIMKKETELAASERNFQSRRDLLATRDAELASRERALVRREETLVHSRASTTRDATNNETIDMYSREQNLNFDRADLDEREQLLEKREQSTARRERVVSERERHLQSEREKPAHATVGGSRAGNNEDYQKTSESPDSQYDTVAEEVEEGELVGVGGNDTLKEVIEPADNIGQSDGVQNSYERKNVEKTNKSTVRKRLSFASPLTNSRPEDPSNTDLGKTNDMEDDISSMQAAEELYNELLAARAFSIERIDRLLGVVQQMIGAEDGTTADGDTIRNVLAELLSLRRSIESANVVEGSADPKERFEKERQGQIEWGVRLRAQLGAIENVQIRRLLKENSIETNDAVNLRDDRGSNSNHGDNGSSATSEAGAEDTEFRMFRTILGSSEDVDSTSQFERILQRARKSVKER